MCTVMQCSRVVEAQQTHLQTGHLGDDGPAGSQGQCLARETKRALLLPSFTLCFWDCMPIIVQQLIHYCLRQGVCMLRKNLWGFSRDHAERCDSWGKLRVGNAAAVADCSDKGLAEGVHALCSFGSRQQLEQGPAGNEEL